MVDTDPILSFVDSIPIGNLTVGWKLLIFFSILMLLIILVTFFITRKRAQGGARLSAIMPHKIVSPEKDQILMIKLSQQFVESATETINELNEIKAISSSSYIILSKYYRRYRNLLSKEVDKYNSSLVNEISLSGIELAGSKASESELKEIDAINAEIESSLDDPRTFLNQSKRKRKKQVFPDPVASRPIPTKENRMEIPKLPDSPKPSIPSPSISSSKPFIPSPSISSSKPSIPSPSISSSMPSIPSPSISSLKPSIPSPSISSSKPSIPSPSISSSKPSIPSPSVSISKPSVPSPPVSSPKPSIPSPEAESSPLAPPVSPKIDQAANPFEEDLSETNDSQFAQTTSIAALRSDMLRELARLRKYIDEGEEKEY